MFVNAIMYYKVQDAIKAVTNVDDYAGSAQALAATTLRNVLGNNFMSIFHLKCLMFEFYVLAFKIFNKYFLLFKRQTLKNNLLVVFIQEPELLEIFCLTE